MGVSRYFININGKQVKEYIRLAYALKYYYDSLPLFKSVQLLAFTPTGKKITFRHSKQVRL